METTSFVYYGCTYKVRIRATQWQEPYLYWCYLYDANLIKQLGQCVFFRWENGLLTTLKNYPLEEAVLIQCLKEAIEQKNLFQEIR